jgi:hypothetical protein
MDGLIAYMESADKDRGRHVSKLEKEGEWDATTEITLDMLKELSLSIDLQCTYAGSDLIWNTGDEKTWTIEGPLNLVRGRRM